MSLPHDYLAFFGSQSTGQFRLQDTDDIVNAQRGHDGNSVARPQDLQSVDHKRLINHFIPFMDERRPLSILDRSILDVESFGQRRTRSRARIVRLDLARHPQNRTMITCIDRIPTWGP